MEEFRKRTEGRMRYEERSVRSAVEVVIEIGRSGEYELVIVGKGQSYCTIMVAELGGRSAELGLVGDTLMSSAHSIASSVLVVQRHDIETPVSLVLDNSEVAVDMP